jgi:hypothetical protein
MIAAILAMLATKSIPGLLLELSQIIKAILANMATI